MGRLDLEFNTTVYLKSRSKYFTLEQDKFLVYTSFAVGYGNWEAVREAAKCDVFFRFDSFLRSRSDSEIYKRMQSLIKVVEKEKELKEAEKAEKEKAKKGGEKEKTAGKATEQPHRSETAMKGKGVSQRDERNASRSKKNANANAKDEEAENEEKPTVRKEVKLVQKTLNEMEGSGFRSAKATGKRKDIDRPDDEGDKDMIKVKRSKANSSL
eukprot:TRINITY_DN8394_c0_g1_i4.p1 TRINITY_DN8394_c0_g1~~TRINITY_DN8394_c0_g1_i4.p1  ORF type:complete len:212 (-),score=84.27 TRINITY_DN8394_c0_g1_i4:139-774(-)